MVDLASSLFLVRRKTKVHWVHVKCVRGADKQPVFSFAMFPQNRRQAYCEIPLACHYRITLTLPYVKLLQLHNLKLDVSGKLIDSCSTKLLRWITVYEESFTGWHSPRTKKKSCRTKHRTHPAVKSYKSNEDDFPPPEVKQLENLTVSSEVFNIIYMAKIHQTLFPKPKVPVSDKRYGM
jgi:hypothetical protein